LPLSPGINDFENCSLAIPGGVLCLRNTSVTTQPE
jgi:hypothetical protein